MTIVSKADLYFREGGSDKVYHAKLSEIGGKYQVEFAYGRRGASLTGGVKVTGVTLQAAQKVYNKLVHDKTSKGYKEMTGNGIPAATLTVADPTDTGFRPQLLNEVEEEDLDTYINDPKWCAQEKYDGRRRGLIRSGGALIGTNRKGLAVAIPDELNSILNEGHYILDSEAVGDKVIIFDYVIQGKSFKERYDKLRTGFVFDGKFVELAPVAWTKSEKLALLSKLKTENAEGIVFKKVSSEYKSGRPNSGGDQLKFKFHATASCIVMPGGNKSKRSVSIAVMDEPGGGNFIPVGNVTVYPNQTIPTTGAIVEVKYLYYFPGGSLFQPVLLHERDDLDINDCLLSKLKVKREEEVDV